MDRSQLFTDRLPILVAPCSSICLVPREQPSPTTLSPLTYSRIYCSAGHISEPPAKRDWWICIISVYPTYPFRAYPSRLFNS